MTKHFKPLSETLHIRLLLMTIKRDYSIVENSLMHKINHMLTINPQIDEYFVAFGSLMSGGGVKGYSVP